MANRNPNLVTIRVTQRDITQGKRAACTACPVARAVLRHLLPGMGVRVTPAAVRVMADGNDTGEGLCRIPLPDQVIDWICDFDLGKAPKPMEFTLDLAHLPEAF